MGGFISYFNLSKIVAWSMMNRQQIFHLEKSFILFFIGI